MFIPGFFKKNMRLMLMVVGGWSMLPCCGYGQSDWIPLINGTPEGDLFYSGPIVITDSKTGFIPAVSAIWKTVDEGKTWRQTRVNTDGSRYNNITKISFPDSEVGYAVGGDQVIFKTTNGGEDWSPLPAPFFGPTSWNQAIHFSSIEKGIVATIGGYDIHYTNDGGTTWNTQRLDENRTIDLLSFPSALVGYIFSPGTVFKTIDGGDSWTVVNSQAPTFLSVSFISPETGFGLSNGDLYKTTDGGYSWDKVSSFASNEWSESISFINEDVGFNFGLVTGALKYSLQRTGDGGRTWERCPLRLRNMAFFDEQTGCGTSDYFVYRTTDGGKTWDIAGSSHYYQSVICLDRKSAVFLGSNGRLRRTNDGGASWAESKPIQGIADMTEDSGRLIAVGCTMQYAKAAGPSRPYLTLAISRGDGVSWEISDIGFVEASPSTIQFPDGDTGYIFGSQYDRGISHIVKSSDGGETWTEKAYPEFDGAQQPHFPTLQTGYIVGWAGRAWKTVDGASTWRELQTGVTDTLRCVRFLSEAHGFAGGDNGTLIMTRDGGTTWRQCNSGSTASIRIIRFINPLSGYFGGTGGVICKTIDGGMTWRRQETHTDKTITCMDFHDLETGYAAGLNGAVLKLGDNPLSIDEARYYPVTFAIKSVPNPFNPSTTISFTLPAAGPTELSVYSITGQKVRTLLSGRMEAGVHAAEWDGRDDAGKPVSSGVYIARMQAGKTLACHKMLLMK